MGWLTGRDRGGGRRARCRRASRRRWGANGRPRASARPRDRRVRRRRQGPSRPGSQRPRRPSTAKCGRARSAPSMTAAARATCFVGDAAGHAHAQHEVLGGHLPRVQIFHHLSVLHPHAPLGVLGHGDGRAPEAQVGLARPVGGVVAALEAGPRVARHLVAVKARRPSRMRRASSMAAASASSSGSCISPRMTAAIEGGVGLDGQRVHRHVVPRRGPPPPARFPRRTPRSDPGMPHIRSTDTFSKRSRAARTAALRRLGVVGAAEDAQHLVVEGLHADGEPVHPERPDIPHHGRRETFGVRLHRALDLGLEMHRHRQRIKEHRKPSHADIARRPPAQIHRLDGPELPLPRGPADIHHERFHVLVDNRRVPLYRRSGEIAVPAPLSRRTECAGRVPYKGS